MKCSFCKKQIDFSFGERAAKRMREKKACFNCDYWDELANDRYDGRPVGGQRIICKGVHTVACAPSSGLQGYGGQPWVITMVDGTLVKTGNLWHQGEIPAHFRARPTMQDNALAVESAYTYNQKEPLKT